MAVLDAAKLLEGTTPGPWRLDDPDSPSAPVVDGNYHAIEAGYGFFDFDSHPRGFGITGFVSLPDATLLAAAPTLATEHAALTAEVARLRSALVKIAVSLSEEGGIAYLLAAGGADEFREPSNG